ncbi:IS1380 family transposase [Candidatus Protofrankia californiensis]|uniref:IS1380 family transposase n=1 Tax=Candidatus Protofrankia californiensis TaxID=1839754 RepID=UPI00104198B1|nr:IS1380 family transposase [Candidatus Protofrankia californiensis]
MSKTPAKRAPRVRIGPVDPSLTGMAGLAAVTELVERLGVVKAFDEQVGPVKQRARGLTGGELLVGMATAQLAGQATLSGLDRLRSDAAGEVLAAVPFAPPATAARLAGRFDPARTAGIEAGVGVLADRWLARLPAQRRSELVRGRPTIDLDSTDVEVYGRGKQGVAYTYEGKRAGRPLLASWARTGLVLAADLLSGDQDVRPRCAGLLARALANLPTALSAAPLVRADSGFFTGELARAAVAAGADFAIAAPRNTALWRAYAAVPETAWTDARDMHGAQVTAVNYAPAGWPPGTYTIIRRVKVSAAEISADPRSRRRRTIPKGQLTLALEGVADHAWAVSFLVTNIPADEPDGIVAVEVWFRGRADIETQIKDVKLGAGLRHLPCADPTVNTVWMWAAILAGWLSTMLQSLTGLDQHAGRAHGDRLRHQLINIPGRLTRHAGTLTLRLPPGRDHYLPLALARLRALPAA